MGVKPSERSPMDSEASKETQSKWLQVVAAGLLGSSCCLLQLLLNVMTTLNIITGIGCAGFNKVLGPIRLQLRTGTVLWMCFAWFMAVKRKLPTRHLLLQTIVFLALTFLPEILLLSGGPALAPATDTVEVIKLKVDGMGCEACQAHVQGVIERAGGVVESAVHLDSGTAEVRVNKNWAYGESRFDLDRLAKQLEEDGYLMEQEL